MERFSLDRDWKFARFGPMPDGTTREEPEGLALPKADDKTWRTLDLPHDWGIEGPFRADLPGNTGKLPWAGIGWYRRSVSGPTPPGTRTFLEIEGAMSHPKVFVDGKLAGEWAYGYASFQVDLTPFLVPGKVSRLAIRLENVANSSRWYPGGGIYRPVWLHRSGPIHLTPASVFVRTPEVSTVRALVAVDVQVENHTGKRQTVLVRQEILSGGRPMAQREESVQVEGIPVAVAMQLPLTAPRLWSVEKPQLYVLRTTLFLEGKRADTTETTFGVRSAVWDAEKGFLLNGQRVALNGVCNHHDLGILGTAVHERAIERQLELLKEMGCNAIRTSHNPPAPALLDACDRRGFLVLDELFDCWERAKTPSDYHLDFAAWHERDLVNFVRRDRNHPCVIAWSCGNEIPEQGNPAKHSIARELVALFHREDPTRLVTAACNNAAAGRNGFSEALDVMGYNYKPTLYGEFHTRYPKQPVYGSETSSCVSSYGEYFFPVEQDKSKGFFNFQCSSYDLYAPPWALKPDLEFVGLDKYPFTAGEFVWTGFDYLGEPTPYNQDRGSPARSSYFGILDLCGFKKDRFYLYQARWRPELPMAHLLPHWNWPDRVGKITPVHVYTSGEEAELFLNGNSLGRKKRGPLEYRLVWSDVLYAPGELKVVAYKGGKRWAEQTRRTTGPAVALKLEVDRKSLSGLRDLSFVTVKVVDAHGDIVPTANHLVRFTLEGSAAELAAVGNGDATDQRGFRGGQYKAFHGLALAILRARYGAKGEVRLRAEAPDIKGAEVKIQVG